MAALVVPGAAVHAQNNPKVFRIASTEEPPILIDYFDVGPAFLPMRIFMQPQWAKLPDGTVVPTLIDELPSEQNGGLSQTADGKSVIKFRIADWAVWSDGQPIVADDFKLVFDVATDGVSNLRASYRFIYGAKVESIAQGATDKDVVITFAGPQPEWANAWILPLPAHVLRAPYEALLKDHKGMDTMVDWLRAPTVGNGPYVFAEWQSGQFVRFTRNPKYWKTPYFDEVVVSFYPDANVLKQLLASGDSDFNAFDIPFLQAYDLANQNPNTVQLQTPFEGERVELEMNQGPKGFPALKDLNVRKAIEMGIDRQYIVDNLYDGKTEVPHSYWDGTAWYNPNTPFFGYDPDGAKNLLRQAGWYDDTGDGVAKAHGVAGVDDGTPLVLKAATLASTDSSEYENTLLTVQEMLGKIGVKISGIDTFNLGVFYGPVSSGGPYATGAYDLYLMHWATGVDTINQFQLYGCADIPSDRNPGGENGSQFCDPEIDQNWKLLGTAMNPDDRQNAVNQIQNIIADKVYTIYMVKRTTALVLNKNIQGFVWGGFAGNPLISLADMTRAGS